jgi:hypothetical protein
MESGSYSSAFKHLSLKITLHDERERMNLIEEGDGLFILSFVTLTGQAFSFHSESCRMTYKSYSFIYKYKHLLMKIILYMAR